MAENTNLCNNNPFISRLSPRRPTQEILVDDDSQEGVPQEESRPRSTLTPPARTKSKFPWEGGCLNDPLDNGSLQQQHSSEPTTISLIHQWISEIRPGQERHHRDTNDRCWQDIQERCQTHPEEAGHLDHRGRTCLHAICAKKPPVAVVKATLKALCGGDTAVVVEQRDKHGRTPLTIAISSNADLDVIALLLAAHPEQAAAAVNDYLGRYPLHLAAAGYDGGQVELVRLLLEAFPEAASRESFNGRTPLHSAVEARASIQVIQQLVDVCPEAVVNDTCGLNPLFIAIRYNADAEVIRCLVKACPEVTMTRDLGKGLPLRRAIENQSCLEVQACLCTSPEIVLDADEHIFNTALHGALECGGNARESTVELLVRTAPEIATTKSKSGKTPLNLACQRYLRLRHRRRNEANSPELRIVILLMQAAFYGRTDYGDDDDDDDERQQQLPVAHAAVSLQIPIEIVLHILETRQNELALRDPREQQFPLHLAIENRPSPDCMMATTRACGGVYVEQKEAIVLKALELFPEAARLPANDGRLGLSLAASASSISRKVLTELCQVNPSAIKTMDAQIGLLPFQIATLPKRPLPRMASEKATEEWRQREDSLQLNAIYFLLRQAPELIQLHKNRKHVW